MKNVEFIFSACQRQFVASTIDQLRFKSNNMKNEDDDNDDKDDDKDDNGDNKDRRSFAFSIEIL